MVFHTCEMDFSHHKSPNPTQVACLFGDKWREIHLTCNTMQNTFSRILYTSRHVIFAKYTAQSWGSWKPCEMDSSHNCCLYGGKSEACENKKTLYFLSNTCKSISFHLEVTQFISQRNVIFLMYSVLLWEQCDILVILIGLAWNYASGDTFSCFPISPMHVKFDFCQFVMQYTAISWVAKALSFGILILFFI